MGNNDGKITPPVMVALYEINVIKFLEEIQFTVMREIHIVAHPSACQH